MRRRLHILIALFLGVYASVNHADEMAEFQKAQLAAQTWLQSLDQGNYATSWQETAEPCKKAITAAQLQTSVNEVRTPLGQLISRQPILAQYTRTLPNAPAGEYVVVQYQTRFANRDTVTETVTPMREGDGVWRVSGYFLK